MSTKGMYDCCACKQRSGESGKDSRLILLSAIPNQKIYRCACCHSFLAYTEDTHTWEVLLQGDLEEELKDLYSYGRTAYGAA